MKHVEQGGEHVLMMSEAEYLMLMRMAHNGAGDRPEDLGVGRGGERAVWLRLVQWAFDGTITD